MANSSQITTTLTVDPALVQNAAFKFDANDRQYIDNQIRGTQQHIVDLLISGVIGTWAIVDGSSATVNAGDVLCTASNATSARYVKKAGDQTVLTGTSRIFGIALTAAAPGSFVRVAIAGAVPPTITGLTTGGGSFVKWNGAGRLTTTTAYASGDFPAGNIDAVGNLTFVPGAMIDAQTVPSFGATTITGTADVVQLTVKGFSTQTSDLQEWKTSGGTLLAAMGPNGFAIGTTPTSNPILINSAASPTVSQLVIKANLAGAIGFLNFSVNNSFETFDAEWSGSAWVARATSAFMINKISGGVQFFGDTGLTNGSTFSPTGRTFFDLATGNWRIGGTTAGGNLLTLAADADTTTIALRVNGKTATTATTGANGAPPAQVVGYLSVNIKGTEQKIPYYAV